MSFEPNEAQEAENVVVDGGAEEAVVSETPAVEPTEAPAEVPAEEPVAAEEAPAE